MTTNQIAYWNLQATNEANRIRGLDVAETARSNRVKEAETAKHNQAIRTHNINTELIDQQRVDESVRHNKVSESIDNARMVNDSWYQAEKIVNEQAANKEKTRANKAKEALGIPTMLLGIKKLFN